MCIYIYKYFWNSLQLFFKYICIYIKWIFSGDSRNAEKCKHIVIHIQRSSGRCGVRGLLDSERLEGSAAVQNDSSQCWVLPPTRKVWPIKIRGTNKKHTRLGFSWSICVPLFEPRFRKWVSHCYIISCFGRNIRTLRLSIVRISPWSVLFIFYVNLPLFRRSVLISFYSQDHVTFFCTLVNFSSCIYKFASLYIYIYSWKKYIYILLGAW